MRSRRKVARGGSENTSTSADPPKLKDLEEYVRNGKIKQETYEAFQKLHEPPNEPPKKPQSTICNRLGDIFKRGQGLKQKFFNNPDKQNPNIKKLQHKKKIKNKINGLPDEIEIRTGHASGTTHDSFDYSDSDSEDGSEDGKDNTGGMEERTMSIGANTY